MEMFSRFTATTFLYLTLPLNFLKIKIFIFLIVQLRHRTQNPHLVQTTKPEETLVNTLSLLPINSQVEMFTIRLSPKTAPLPQLIETAKVGGEIHRGKNSVSPTNLC